MTLPQVNELDGQISQMSKAEIAAFKDFEQVYKVQHPYPQEEKAVIGWESWSTLIVAVSSVVLAAFRTSQAFYLAAVARGNILLSALESISAVFAIEGSVILFALQRARESKRTDARSSELGLWVAFLISILAGLYQSINIVLTANDTVSTVLSWVLAVAMGIGATLIAWLSGDILGVYLTRLEIRRSEVHTDLEAKVHSYRANMLKEWKKSLEQGAVQSQKSSRYGVSRSQDSSRTVHEPNEPRPPVTMEEMYEIFDGILKESGGVAGVGETARELMRRRNTDKSDTGWENLKSRVSGARKKWMVERKIEHIGE